MSDCPIPRVYTYEVDGDNKAQEESAKASSGTVGVVGSDVGSDLVAPSGIGAVKPQETVHDDFKDAESEDAPGSSASSAAAADNGCKITPAELVIKESVEPESYKAVIDLIEKLREILRVTYHHSAEVSILLAFAHWYGEIMPFGDMKARGAAIAQWTDTLQLLAAVVTQLSDIICGTNVEITQVRQNSLELCYSVRWPVALSFKHSSSNFCRGSRGVVLANAERFAEIGWLKKDTWAFRPECTTQVFDTIQEHIKNLGMATQALKMALDRFRNQRVFSDLNKLHEYLFYDIPPLAMPSFPDFLWRLYQIMTVFTNLNYSDKRRYSAEDQKLALRLSEEETNAEMSRLAKAIEKLPK
jgi:hypothetical protein